MFSLSKFYAIFAPQSDGFAEFVVVVSLAAMVTLAFMSRLTDSFAGALTAIGSLGVIHDNVTCWLASRTPNRRDIQKDI